MDNGWRKLNYCPYCNKKVDAATHLPDAKAIPEPGDVSVCIDCYQASQFDSKLKLQKVDVTELDLQQAREVHQLQIFLRQAKERYKNGER